MANAFQRTMLGLRKLYGFFRPPKRRRPVDVELNPEVEAANRAWMFYDSRMTLAQTRIEVYKEMEEMDDDDIIHSALDAFAEDSTQPDPFTNRTVWIESPNLELQGILHEFFDTVELEDQIFSIVRNTCKYGDDFEQVITAEGKGIIGVEWLNPKQVERTQDGDGRITGWKVYDGEIPATIDQPLSMDPGASLDDTASPWDVVHFRLLGGQRKSQRADYYNRGVIYGQSVVYAARRVFRRFRMMEDSMLMYRQQRAPDRDVYKIDCTGLNPAEQWEHAARWYKAFKKRQYISNVTGDYKTEMNPLAADQDIFLPVVEGRNTTIERQAGSANVGDIADIDFAIRRVFSCLRIPKEYFGFDDDGWDQAKALAQKDIRFARTCKRIQRSAILGITRLCQIHLAYLGIDPTLAQNDFTVKMTPMSLLEEQDRAELYTVRMELIEKLVELGKTLGLDAKRWAYFVVRTFGGFPEQISKGILQDIEPEEAEAGGGLGGGLGGGGGLDLGGGEEGGLDLGGGGLDLGGGGEEAGGGLDLGGGEEAAAGGEEELGVALERALAQDPQLRRLAEGYQKLAARRGGVEVRSSELPRDPLPPIVAKP